MKSGYKDYLDQYTNLANQPTRGDELGDAFTKLGSQPALGSDQRFANAVHLGLGSGFKGSANEQRREKLSPMLEEAGRLTAEAAKIEAQTQKAQQYQFAVQEFGQKYTPLVATFAELVNNNDPRATIVFKDLVNKAGSIPGYENLEAESWDSSKGYGLALNTQTGEYRKITADEMISAIAPSAQAIYGDKWFEKFLPLNAGVAKDAQYAFNTNRQATELGMSEKRADIENKYSQANVHNTQAEKTKREMNNPAALSPMEEFNLKTNKQTNEKYLEKLGEEITTKDPRTKIQVLDKLKDLLSSESAFGGTPKDAFVRYIKKTVGSDEKIQEARMLQKYFFPDIKGVAGNPNAKEWDDLVTRIISGEENVESALNVIEFEKTQAQGMLDQYDDYANVLAETNYSTPHHHPEITSKVKNRRSSMGKPEQNGKDKNVDQLKKQYFIK